MTEVELVDFEDDIHQFNFGYHFECGNFENDKTIFKQFIHDIQLSKDGPLLENYFKSGGSLDDFYSYFQKGNGDFIAITIPVMIVLSGNMNLLKTMIETNKSFVNYSDNEYPLLSHAFIHRRFEMVDYLLENGANPSEFGRRAKMPLYFAINANNPKYVKKLLVDYKVNPNSLYSVAQLNYLSEALTNASYICDPRMHSFNKITEGFDINKLDDDDAHIIRLLIEADATLQEDKVNESAKKIYWTVMNFYVIKNDKIYNCSKLLKCERDELGI